MSYSSHPTSAISLSGLLQARGGLQGAGGTVIIKSAGAGGITIEPDTIAVDAPYGPGGTIITSSTKIQDDVRLGGQFTFPSGPVTIKGNLSANASNGDFAGGRIIITGDRVAIQGVNDESPVYSVNGSGNGSGGLLAITSTNIAVSGDKPLVLQADSTGTGSGGSVVLTASDHPSNVLDDQSKGNIDLGSGANQIQIFARGGSVDSNSGDGGWIFVNAGQNLTIHDDSALNANGQGANGAGGHYDLAAGTLGGANGIIVDSCPICNGASSSLGSGDSCCGEGGGGNSGSYQFSFKTGGNSDFTGPRTARNGNLVFSGATNLNANGGGATGDGSGDGGYFRISATSAAALDLSLLTLSADGGSTQGYGGHLVITNTGTGGIKLSTAGSLTAIAHNSPGGEIDITAGTNNNDDPSQSTFAPLTFTGGGTLSADGGDDFSGGTLKIWSSAINMNNSAHLTFSASGQAGGGQIYVTTSGSLHLGKNSGEIELLATGGAAGSSSVTSGGSITVSAGSDISISDLSAVSVQSLGTDGSSGSLSLTAGVNGDGTLSVAAGTWTARGGGADGTGFGNGATIRLAATSPAVIDLSQVSITVDAGESGGQAGQLTVTNYGGGLTLGSANNYSAHSHNAAGSNGLSLNASDTLSIGSGTLSADANNSGDGGDYSGGTVYLSSQSLVVTGGQQLILSARGVGNGDGGLLTVSTSSKVTIDSGKLELYATGGSQNSSSGSGGTISVSANDITVGDFRYMDASPLGNNGSGASYSLTAAQRLNLPSGTLNSAGGGATGNGTGHGGSLQISQNEDGRALNLTNVILTTEAGRSSLSGDGRAGLLQVISSGDLTIGTMRTLAHNGAGASSVQLSTGGILTVSTGEITASADGNDDYFAGNVTISARTIQLSGSGNLRISANATGSRRGGTITADADTLEIGLSSGQLQFYAHGGQANSSAGDGGSIYLHANHDLVIHNLAAVDASPLGNNGRGATYSFTAGSSDIDGLLILKSGTLNANGATLSGHGGQATLTSTSSRVMDLTSVTLNLDYARMSLLVSANVVGRYSSSGLI